MSLLYKRPDSANWYVAQTRESTGTTNRKDAEAFARKALSRAWGEKKLGDKLYTFADLTASWLDEKSEKRALKEDKRVIRDFGLFLVKRKLNTALSTIDAGTLREYAKQVRLRASASTANGHMRILRAMLNHAVAEGMLTVRPPVKMFEVIHAPRAALTLEQIAAIGESLEPWIRDMFIFAGQTGLRWGNVAGLRWEWITPDYMIALVPAIVTKTKRSYTVPLSSAARAILERRKPYRDSSGLVFYNPKKPGHAVKSVKTQWERACTRASVTDVCWHLATRHTWASLHTMNGTPDRVIQEMAGWSSPAMLQKYVHLKTEHLVSYADNVNRLRGTEHVNRLGKVVGETADAIARDRGL